MPDLTPHTGTTGDLSVLDAPTDPALLKKRDGAGSQKFDYIPAAAVQRLLTKAFGHGWSFQIMSREVVTGPTKDFPDVDIPNEILVGGRLSYIVDGRECFREQYGAQTVEYSNDYKAGKDSRGYYPKSNRPVSIAKATQGATTKALRKCAESLGIGLDLKEGGDVMQETVTGRDLRLAIDSMAITVDSALALVSNLYGKTIPSLADLRHKQIQSVYNFLSVLYDSHAALAPATDLQEFVLWLVATAPDLKSGPEAVEKAATEYAKAVREAGQEK